MICETGLASWFSRDTIGKECTADSWYSPKTMNIGKKKTLEQTKIQITTGTGNTKQIIEEFHQHVVLTYVGFFFFFCFVFCFLISLTSSMQIWMMQVRTC